MRLFDPPCRKKAYVTEYTIQECIALLNHKNVFDRYSYRISNPPRYITFTNYLINGMIPYFNMAEMRYWITWQIRGERTILRLEYDDTMYLNSQPMGEWEMDFFFKTRIAAMPL